jgi:hypothetical protein
VRYFETLRKGGLIPERKNKIALIFNLRKRLSPVYPERVVLDSDVWNLEKNKRMLSRKITRSFRVSENLHNYTRRCEVI